MQIHVVRLEETLNNIAQAYGSSASKIAEANQVANLNGLVTGMPEVSRLSLIWSRNLEFEGSTIGSWEMTFLRIGFSLMITSS